MPIIKHISIRSGVNKFLSYIEQAYKTQNGTLITGVNISADINEAYQAFRDTYNIYSMVNNFDKQTINDERNSKGHKIEHGKIVMHHYVQSFSPDEKITPGEANAIGVEWAKKVFGNDFQFIVSTHVDKNHIHNHFAVCPFSLSGKRWNSNKKTLNYCRKISDEIAKAHGLSIIENPQTKNNGKRKEWEARQNGTSWKKALCDKLDALILKDNINTLEDIQRELQNEGYYVRLGKYMTIKPPDQKRSIRTENLDRIYGGYSMRELEYRLKHKNKEISISAISQMSGLQKYYAIYMRSLQITVFKTNGKQDKNKTYRHLVKTADLLTYITLNNVRSEKDLEWLKNKRKEEYEELRNTKRSLEKRIKKLTEEQGADGNIQIEELQRELELIDNSIEDAYNKMREAEKFYEQYKEEYCTDDYSRALEEYRQLNKMLEETSDKDNERENDTPERDPQYDNYTI